MSSCAGIDQRRQLVHSSGLELAAKHTMTNVNISRANNLSLPQSLSTAQEAIRLPEVQDMLRRLSEYKLGIFMPHMHDEITGEFQPLPDQLMQVESGLETSFQPTEETATGRFLPVGWFWRAGASTTSAVCEMVGDEGHSDVGRTGKHKMRNGD